MDPGPRRHEDRAGAGSRGPSDPPRPARFVTPKRHTSIGSRWCAGARSFALAFEGSPEPPVDRCSCAWRCVRCRAPAWTLGILAAGSFRHSKPSSGAIAPYRRQDI
jgi:hypothetical protein